MGKTKTAFVTDVDQGEKKSSEELYKERLEKRKAKKESLDSARDKKVHIAGLKGGQRVKIVEAAPTEESPVLEEVPSSAKTSAGLREPKKKIEPGKTYSIKDAVKLVKETSYSKFDGTMELHIVVKKTGTSAQVTLPHSAGREKKVEIADEGTIKKLTGGKVDFDVLIATPDMMPKLVPFARILGPKGLMPNPKNGTLVPDLKKAKGFSAGTLSLKTEKEAPLVHTVVGKNSQKDEEIIANTQAIFKALGGDKQIARAFIKSTMSPSVKLQVG